MMQQRAFWECVLKSWKGNCFRGQVRWKTSLEKAPKTFQKPKNNVKKHDEEFSIEKYMENPDDRLEIGQKLIKIPPVEPKKPKLSTRANVITFTQSKRFYSNCDNKENECKIDDNVARHGYHIECEKAVNEQILAELNAAYAYLSMSAYFGRTQVALPGCYGYFFRMHEDELRHAHKFIRYQNMRGGKVHLCPLTCTECTEWGVKKSLEVALEMEKLVKDKLVYLHDVAEQHHDLNLMDLIVTEFIEEQEKSIAEFGRLLFRFRNMEGCKNCSCAEYLYDKEVHQAFVLKEKAARDKDFLLEDEKIYK